MSRNAPPPPPLTKETFFWGERCVTSKKTTAKETLFLRIEFHFLSPSSTRAIFKSKHSTQNFMSDLPNFCRAFTRIEGVLLSGTLYLRNFMGNHTCKFPLSRAATLGENTGLPSFKQNVAKKASFHEKPQQIMDLARRSNSTTLHSYEQRICKNELPHFGKFLWTLTWKSSGMISSSGLTNEWRKWSWRQLVLFYVKCLRSSWIAENLLPWKSNWRVDVF